MDLRPDGTATVSTQPGNDIPDFEPTLDCQTCGQRLVNRHPARHVSAW